MTYSFRSDCIPLNNLVVNQTLDIKAQLKAGIRALDMRVRLDNGQFLCVHSGFYLNVTWLKALRDISEFLSQNSGEAVVMRLKKEKDDRMSTRSFLEVLQANMQSYDRLFFISADNTDIQPSLKQARGKIVLYYDNFAVPCALRKNIGYPWEKQNLEDLYAIDSAKDYIKVKWPAIQSGLKSAADGTGAHPGSMYFNFTSASPTWKSIATVHAGRAAAVLKPLTLSWPGWYLPTPIHAGCIMMDFPENTPDLIGTIIRSNFPKDNFPIQSSN